MKHRAWILLFGLLLAVSCAERKPIAATNLQGVLFTLIYHSGGDAPIGCQVTLLKNGQILVNQPGRRTASYVLTHKEFSHLNSLINVADFRNTIRQQQSIGPKFACCDAREVGFSFGPAPILNGQTQVAAFRLNEPIPRSLGELMAAINDALVASGAKVFLEKWQTADG